MKIEVLGKAVAQAVAYPQRGNRKADPAKKVRDPGDEIKRRQPGGICPPPFTEKVIESLRGQETTAEQRGK